MNIRIIILLITAKALIIQVITTMSLRVIIQRHGNKSEQPEQTEILMILISIYMMTISMCRKMKDEQNGFFLSKYPRKEYRQKLELQKGKINTNESAATKSHKSFEARTKLEVSSHQKLHKVDIDIQAEKHRRKQGICSNQEAPFCFNVILSPRLRAIP